MFLLRKGAPRAVIQLIKKALGICQGPEKHSLPALLIIKCMRGIVPFGWAYIQLAWAADAVRVTCHFIPVRDPACRARKREHDREHVGWNADRTQDEARVEIDVRV